MSAFSSPTDSRSVYMRRHRLCGRRLSVSPYLCRSHTWRLNRSKPERGETRIEFSSDLVRWRDSSCLFHETTELGRRELRWRRKDRRAGPVVIRVSQSGSQVVAGKSVSFVSCFDHGIRLTVPQCGSALRVLLSLNWSCSNCKSRETSRDTPVLKHRSRGRNMSGKTQSARQRKANEAFARKEDAKRGKPTRLNSKKATVKRSTSQKLVIGMPATQQCIERIVN